MDAAGGNWRFQLKSYHWLTAALLLALIVFANTLDNGFVFDDHFLIVNNSSLAEPGYLARVFKPAPQDSPVKGSPGIEASFTAYYRPFTRALFAINYLLFGINARAWHAVNLLLYLISVLLAFLVLKSVVPRAQIYGPATLLFALHPIHSEVVSWANCLVETLHAVFYLSAFLCFLHARQSPRAGAWLILSLLAAQAAIFTKEIAVTLPLLIIGYTILDTTRSWRARIKQATFTSLPYFVIIGIYLLLRARAGGAPLASTAASKLDVTLRTIPTVVIKYLSLLMAPVDLSPAYPIRPVASFASLQFIVPALILVVLAVAAARFCLRDSALTSALLLLFVPLLPLLNVGMLLPEMLVQDRYLFLPSLGFALLLTLLFARLPITSAALRPVLLIIVITAYGALAAVQNSYWQDNFTLFSHAITVDAHSSFAHINLGGAYAEAGDTVSAEREYTEALRINPDCAICYANLADFSYRRGDYQQGVAFYGEALRYGYRDAFVLHAYAVGSMQIGAVAQAIGAFEEIAARAPSAAALTNLAQAYLAGGDSARAIKKLEEATALEAGNADRHYLLGRAYERANRRDEAGQQYRRALELNPGHLLAKENLNKITGN